MKALILGADGMIGHVVKLYFQEQGYEVKGTSRSDSQDLVFDATLNTSDLGKFIDDFKPDAVVNCIGILNKVAEENHSLAVMVNSYLPKYKWKA